MAIILNPKPAQLDLGELGSEHDAEALYREFHGEAARNGTPRRTRRRTARRGNAYLVEIGPAISLQVDGKLRKLKGYTAYASPDGLKLFVSRGMPTWGAKLYTVGTAEVFTYEGPTYSDTKRPAGQRTHWEHLFGAGVQVVATRGRKTYVVSGGGFVINDWLRH